MNYHPDDFLALSAAVEAEGGSFPADPCTGKEFRLRLPDASGKKVWKRLHTTHCDLSALLEIPYESSTPAQLLEDDPSYSEPVTIVDHPGEDLPPKKALVCAVDDCVGLWPRYAGLVTKRSYQKL